MSRSSSKQITLSREELDAQVADFLKKGGTIDQIPPGVSGMQGNHKGPKHIRITPAKR